MGCSKASANYLNIITRIMEEIHHHIHPDTKLIIPADSERLVTEFGQWLEKAVVLSKSSARKVIILLDGYLYHSVDIILLDWINWKIENTRWI